MVQCSTMVQCSNKVIHRVIHRLCCAVQQIDEAMLHHSIGTSLCSAAMVQCSRLCTNKEH
jgi:hypothetical protein